MSSSISQTVRELAEPKLAEFTAKLIPTVDPERILGVRMPALRKLAKKLLREHPQEVTEFMAAVPHDFQEEDLLHMLLLNEERDFTTWHAGITNFLPYMTNWTLTDAVSPTCVKGRNAANLPQLERACLDWMVDDRVYVQRLGVVVLMSLLGTEYFSPEHLRKEYEYYGIETCAVDGMCQTRCPVNINTGDLIRRLRSENQDKLAATGWKVAAQQWGVMDKVAGKALTVAKKLPFPVVHSTTSIARKVMGDDMVPSYKKGLPVVCDASSCTEGLEVMRKKVIEALEHKIVNGLKPGEPDFSRLRMYDAVQFAADNMLDKLTVSAPLPSIALHPTCSMTHLGTQPAFEKIANAMSADVYVPKHWGCCGYAGDRGMLHPELTASATEAEAAELSEQKQFAAYISANRTCEQGMTEATGHTYQNVLQLLERTTR
ncbi:DNA alkylation repair protein [Rothia sp. HMSC069C01]|uniref:DNA alkylation repair protein n=1 Tax=Rothia sp. HMSC069C01 TaxID=1739485 RepID=UPI000A5A1D38|nr:DNA alkylation repair protein [Rothia sp. HMSC069C01]